jgi:signal transduction histidine kinase
LIGLLTGAWLLVVGWQAEEHERVVQAARLDLHSRAHEIQGTLSAVTRAFRFHGTIFQERLELVLRDLVSNRTNSVVKLMYVGLLNTNGEPLVADGDTNLLSHENLVGSEIWFANHVTLVLPIEEFSASPEGGTNNATVVIPTPPRNGRREPHPEDNPALGANHDPHPGENAATNPSVPSFTNQMAATTAMAVGNPPSASSDAEPQPPQPPPGEGDHPRPNNRRPPPWMRGMSEGDIKAFMAKRELHGLVLAMSTDNYRALCTHDLWLRYVIGFFAGISALGAGLAWRNMGRTAELQIRLVRASELNSHLKELNLAAAGLAHETRNPLNIIRGQAQMLSRLPNLAPEITEKSRIIVDETDKVTAQLTEFINYSRPREVRRTRVALNAAGQEILRTLALDIQEKKLQVEVAGDALTVEADEQLLRQVLFNLLINAIQAVSEEGKIQIFIQRDGPAEARLEVRDDGPGVPLANRQEIFKPYFTTHQKGTGLGLAVVQQIIQAHGWEITCLGQEPHGAIFRITHLKIAS